MKKVVYLLIVGMMGWVQAAEADIICLRNGNIIEGIIVQDTDEILELEVFLGAKITFAKQDIAYLKKWDEEKNEALREEWRKDREEREKAELTRQEFESGQREKGLVKYKGKWITKPEKDKLKTREYVDEVLKAKVDRGEIVESEHRERTDISRTLLAKGNWRHRQTEHFIIYYEDIMQSKIVAGRAEYYYEKIAYDLDYEKTIYWPQKCEVFIIPSEEKWEEYMGEFTQGFDYIGGFVPSTGEKEIYLCALSLPYLSVTFPHELTHLIFAEFSKAESIPLWLNEGLAIYESGLIGYADELLRNKVKAAEHIPLKEVMQMESYPETRKKMELFYAQAQKSVEFLITQHGRKEFSRFCELLISGKSFGRALDFVYGHKYYNEDEFKRAWIKYVLR